nr:MAG TPA_asm: hypothetical protein [Caudoviricetes sp.]
MTCHNIINNIQASSEAFFVGVKLLLPVCQAIISLSA